MLINRFEKIRQLAIQIQNLPLLFSETILFRQIRNEAFSSEFFKARHKALSRSGESFCSGGEASTHCFVPWKTKYTDMFEGFIDSISKSAKEVGRVFKTLPCNVKINIATQLACCNKPFSTHNFLFTSWVGWFVCFCWLNFLILFSVVMLLIMN